MDPFTERMLERARARREKLDKQLNSVGESCGKRRTPLQENNPIAVSDAFEEHHEEDSGSSITDGVRTRLRRLGALYSDAEQLSSPIHRTESDFSVEPVPQRGRTKSAMRSARLAALANSINQWEDDLSHPSITVSTTKDKTTLPAKSISSHSLVGVKRKSTDKSKTEVDSHNIINVTSPRLPGLRAIRKSGGHNSSTAFEVTASPRQLQWDKALLDSLEAQGFCRSDSNSRLIYDFEQEDEVASSVTSEGLLQGLEEESPSKNKVCSPLKTSNTGSPVRSPLVMGVAQLRKNVSPLKQPAGSPSKSLTSPSKAMAKTPVKADSVVDVSQPEGSVLQRAAKYESEAASPPKRLARDPAELPLAERIALFEKNKGQSLISKISASPSAPSVAPPPLPPPPPVPNSPQLECNADSSKSPPWRSPRRAAPKDAYPGVTEVKRIKVSPPKPGHLYPSLSDVEATTETEDTSSANQSVEDEDSSVELGTADDSFGKDILEAAEKVHSSYRSTQDSKDNVSITESAVLRDMDDFLEDALGESSDEDRSPTPPKKTRGSPSKKSDSFYYKPPPSSEPEATRERKSPRRTSTKYPAPPPPVQSTPSSEDQQAPLVHTVSFYRKQQNMTPKTPVTQVLHEEKMEPPVSQSDQDSQEKRKLVEIKVRQLLDEVSKQQTVIFQASQALNLCNATVEFACSAEQVEAEKLLLHATHKRQAAQNEIQRLKFEGDNPDTSEHTNLTEHGTLLIKDIALPVKSDFVRSLAIEDNSHHFVCLAKCQDIVLATSVASVSNARDLKEQAVCFPSCLSLNDLPTNFRVTLEVYTFTCRKEMLPHDVKYHINKKDISKRMTPKKQKQESHLVRRPVQSPAGPGAVRTSQFSLIGFVIFSLREIQRTTFTLNKVPYTSPLQGSIQFHVECDLSIDIEHRGFLSMYDVVSGFGAWHRRWCLLKGDMLSFWRYPDHEAKEIAAIDSIDLKTCVTDNVGLVSRDLCARLHTFLLETTRPARPTDEDSLVLTCKGTKTHVRHLLSADTREERIEWCNKLNKALSVMRAWNKRGEY